MDGVCSPGARRGLREGIFYEQGYKGRVSHTVIRSSSVVKEIKMFSFFQVSAFTVSLYLLFFSFFFLLFCLIKMGENIVSTSPSPALQG